MPDNEEDNINKEQNDKQEEQPNDAAGDRVIAQSITGEMKDAYIDYAMSVITARALPDVRDGLKPVHRRILYAMKKMGLTSGAKFRKSAAVVGEVLGKYHPHGDKAVYDSLVNMAQTFSSRYPLAIGQGNFGSIDGDPAAAMRYTEAKMSSVAESLLEDINKDTVDFRDNYDATTTEPEVLPAAVPGLLLNGTLGIAVGMATKIPPHNLQEIANAVVHLIDNEDATVDDLMEFVKGPDFPTGAMVFGEDDIRSAYTDGRGGVVMRGEAEIIERTSQSYSIIISSLPYQVNKSRLIEKIADMVNDDTLEGIKDIRDESTSDIRVVIDLKRNAYPQKVLNSLYKNSRLEKKFHFNMVALVDGVPQTLSLKGILEEYIDHRIVVVRRRSEHQLAKAKDREHILLGLQKALDHIDRIITLIRESKDKDAAHAELKSEFDFSDEQATAILRMRLQRLAGMERQEIEDELNEVQATIAELEELLSSEENIKEQVKTEIKSVAEEHGDKRRTRVKKQKVDDIDVEDLIADEDSVLVFTKDGYVKRTDPKSYKRQKRGGVGVVDIDTKEDDYVTTVLSTSTHSDLLFFTDQGRVFKSKMYEMPESGRSTRGKSIVNFLELESDESVTSILPVAKDTDTKNLTLAMTTKYGRTKRVDATEFDSVRSSGLIAISLEDDDELVSAQFAQDDDEMMIITDAGRAIRFAADEVRTMGRTAKGVRGVKLDDGDAVISGLVVHDENQDGSVFVVTENGFGKRTELEEYSTQGRGGKGVKTANLSDTTGQLVDAVMLTDEDQEAVAMSRKAQVIRIDTDDISTLGRNTKGVKVMELKDDDTVACLVSL
jgi:DNA gyrase subunit A